MDKKRGHHWCRFSFAREGGGVHRSYLLLLFVTLFLLPTVLQVQSGYRIAETDEFEIAKTKFIDALNALEKGNRDKAIRILKDAARFNHADAMHNLGVLYLTGNGVECDPEKAREWIKKSADLWYARAQEALLKLQTDH